MSPAKLLLKEEENDGTECYCEVCGGHVVFETERLENSEGGLGMLPDCPYCDLNQLEIA